MSCHGNQELRPHEATSEAKNSKHEFERALLNSLYLVITEKDFVYSRI